MKPLLPFGLYLGILLALAIIYHRTEPGAVAPAYRTTIASAEAKDFTAPSNPPPVKASSLPPSPVSPPPVSLLDDLTRALQSGSAGQRDHALLVLLPRLIDQDPAAAAGLALAWPPGPLRDEFLRQVVHHWSAIDIGGALTWLTTLIDENDRRLAAAASTAQVRQGDPAGALDLAQVLRVGLDDGSFEHLAQLWTEEKPADAIDWAMTQPAGPMRDRLLARIAWVRAQNEPAGAAGLVLNHMQPGDSRTAALLSVVRQWAVREPAEAAEWVGHFPPGPLRTRAIAELEVARKTR